MKKLLFLSFIVCCFISCNKKTNVASETGIIIEDTSVVAGYSHNDTPSKPASLRGRGKITGDVNVQNFLPNATIFRMNGNYSKNVAVTLSPEGRLLYFPAPSDITADSEPIKLNNGWWLNCQGIGPNSVFTKYTFVKYSELPEAPSPDQIKLEIIPGSRVTDFRELPFKMNEAVNNLDEVNKYIDSL